MRPNLAGRSDAERAESVRQLAEFARLDSNRAVRCRHVGVDPERLAVYVVRDWVQGVSFEQSIQQIGPLSPAAVARVLVDVAGALESAHAQGLAPGNLKPSNILLEQCADGILRAKLADFFGKAAIAPLRSPQATLANAECADDAAALVYVAPEQIAEPPRTDQRTDIRAPGMCLHRALTGVRPWSSAESVNDVVLALTSRELDAVDALAPWVPPALCTAVARAVRRNPAERNSSLRDLVDDEQRAVKPFPALRRPSMGAQPSFTLSAPSDSPARGQATAQSHKPAPPISPTPSLATLPMGSAVPWLRYALLAMGGALMAAALIAVLAWLRL